jgi:transcriptional regulator with XRE-family HTH domain
MKTMELKSGGWTNVQYNHRMKREPVVNIQRIRQEIERKGLKPGEIAEQSGVKYDTLYKILNKEKPRTSAEFVARLAAYFNCSVEYLLGMTDHRAPVVLDISAELEDLIDIVRRLPGHRQRDLVAIARTYLEGNEGANKEALMSDLLDLMKEVDDEDYDHLLDFLNSNNRTRNLLSENDTEQTNEDDS